jgi:hypothetical protein
MNLNSLIMTKVRPTVVFDPANRDHRYHAYQFIKNRTLKDCPYIFALPEGHDNVHQMVLTQMAHYYAEQEFGVVEKQRPGKIRKVVDIR